jgi:hypothetical protein
VYREGKIITTPFLEGRLPPAQVEGEVMSEGKERLNSPAAAAPAIIRPCSHVPVAKLRLLWAI